jgi:hypothetical protein
VKLAALEEKAKGLKADVDRVELSIDNAKAEIKAEIKDDLHKLHADLGEKLDRLSNKMDQKVDRFTLSIAVVCGVLVAGKMK